jgi:uncharacterized protein YbaR (Trm112 family)
MIKPELLNILRCPETRQKLTMAEPALIGQINGAIAAARLRNRGGNPVSEKIDGGLVREDGKFLYPIRATLPIMLIDEAIALPIA